MFNCNPTLDLRGRNPQNLKHTWSVPSLRTSIGFCPQFSFDLEINSEYLSGFSTKTWLFCTDLWTVKKIGDLYSGPNFDIYCKILQLHPISTQNYHKLCKICVKYNSVQKLLHHFKNWWYQKHPIRFFEKVFPKSLSILLRFIKGKSPGLATRALYFFKKRTLNGHFPRSCRKTGPYIL